MYTIVSDFLFFFFNDTATTEIYTLSLHDALPICARARHLPRLRPRLRRRSRPQREAAAVAGPAPDRKSTRLNSSHSQISYAVFCLKKKKVDALEFRHRPHQPDHDEDHHLVVPRAP